jgi:3',5'-cyclic AMP phosphodiesterase CpdA
MIETFTLAHLTDVHLSPVQGFFPKYWNVKRALGFLNWHRKRKWVHQRAVADQLLADALALRVDHIAITGDLINLGLPAEYDAALEWIAAAGPPDRVTVVPGNHDIYTRLKGHAGAASWAPYMGAEPNSLAFPFVRHVGPLALIGLNSAVETPPFVASGRLGAHQIEVAGDLLESLGEEGAIRVVLIHHPPLPGLAKPRRELEDAAMFARALKKSGAELVLHGHNHRDMLNWESSQYGHVPVIGAGSASSSKLYKQETLARYNVFTFFQSDTGVRIRHAIRGLESPGGPVVKLSETILEFKA